MSNNYSETMDLLVAEKELVKKLREQLDESQSARLNMAQTMKYLEQARNDEHEALCDAKIALRSYRASWWCRLGIALRLVYVDD